MGNELLNTSRISKLERQMKSLLNCFCNNCDDPIPPVVINQNNKVVNIQLVSDTSGTPINQLVGLINNTNDFIAAEDENVVFNLIDDEGFEYQFLFNAGKGHFGIGFTLVNPSDFTPLLNLNLITATTDNIMGTNGAGIISENVRVISAYDGHLQFIDSPEGISGVLGHTVLSLSDEFLNTIVLVADFPNYLNDNNVVLAVPGAFTAGRIPFTTNPYELQDSSRLLWNNANSEMEINGNTFFLKFKENISNRFITIGNPGLGSGSLVFKNQQGKTLLYLQNPTSTPSQGQFGVGPITNIPTETQFYVFGGHNGANIDMRGSITRDEANTDWEGNDWDISPNSIGISYFGSAYALGGTIMGYPKIKTGVIRWGEADNALIVSNKFAGLVPIRFGINNIEIANVNDKGLSYQSDFALLNSANPRWLTDKEYVDNVVGALGFIPITGTTVGNPVSGNIELEGGGSGIRLIQTQGTVTKAISFNTGDELLIEMLDSGSGLNTTITLSPTQTAVDSNDPASRGISSVTDFTPNITALDFTQKVYVDATIQATVDAAIDNQVSSAGTLPLTTNGLISYFTFTGTTTTWTAPAIAGNTKKRMVIINQGSGNITLNSNAGGNDLWESGVLSNSVTIVPGQTASIYNNGINWSILN